MYLANSQVAGHPSAVHESTNPLHGCSKVQTIPNFRIRTIPVLGTLPAIFGMAAASWILCQLAGAPFFSEPVFFLRRPQYEALLEGLQDDEIARLGHCDDVAVDLEEVCLPACHCDDVAVDLEEVRLSACHCDDVAFDLEEVRSPACHTSRQRLSPSLLACCLATLPACL